MSHVINRTLLSFWSIGRKKGRKKERISKSIGSVRNKKNSDRYNRERGNHLNASRSAGKHACICSKCRTKRSRWCFTEKHARLSLHRPQEARQWLQSTSRRLSVIHTVPFLSMPREYPLSKNCPAWLGIRQTTDLPDPWFSLASSRTHMHFQVANLDAGTWCLLVLFPLCGLARWREHRWWERWAMLE